MRSSPQLEQRCQIGPGDPIAWPLEEVKGKIEGPVCLVIPRSGPVPVCPNGHFVCLVCQPCLTNDSLCPTYRVDMGAGKSLLATTIIQQIDHNCKLDGCNEALTLEGLDKHESGWYNRTVMCPYPKCPAKVSLANLEENLKMSMRCCVKNLECKKLLLQGPVLLRTSPGRLISTLFWGESLLFSLTNWKESYTSCWSCLLQRRCAPTTGLQWLIMIH